MIAIRDLLKEAKEHGASDLHLSVGVPPKMRIDGKLKNMKHEKLSPSDTLEVLISIMSVEQRERFEDRGELDASFSITNIGRYRLSAYKQRGTVALAIRLMGDEILEAESLRIPKAFLNLRTKKRGLILVTGPAGSGLSTTIAALIDQINSTEESLVITLEDPIEYMHHHKKSMVNQREIGLDTKNYATALQTILREDPNVIYIGTMLDCDTMRIAFEAAEAGCLVISSLHAIGAKRTIMHIVNSFGPQEQAQIRLQLANVLLAVASQQLVPVLEGRGRIPAFEIMLSNNRIREILREDRFEELNDVIASCGSEGMCLMDDALLNLYHEKMISAGYTVRFAEDKDKILQEIGEIVEFS